MEPADQHRRRDVDDGAADGRLDDHRRGPGLRLRAARPQRQLALTLLPLDAGLQPDHAGDDP